MNDVRRLFPRTAPPDQKPDGDRSKAGGVDPRDSRLFELLNQALVHRIDGNEGQCVSTLLTAVEVAYGMGKLPSDLTAIVDDVNRVRRVMGSALPPERPTA